MLLLIVANMLILALSCKEDKKADYEGSWIITGTLPVDNQKLEYREIVTFSKDAVNDIAQVKNPTTKEWTDIMGFRAKVLVLENKMYVTITEIGITSLDAVSGDPTGTILYYKDGEDAFEKLLSQNGMKKESESEYVVASNKLYLKTDYNEDGDYKDGNEVLVYTRL